MGYYDTKGHGALSLYFLLPEVIPIEPFSIGLIRENSPAQVADVAILASGPNFEGYLNRLEAAGKLRTSDYGFGLGELSAETVPGNTAGDLNPRARQFLGVVDGQRVLISCMDYHVGGLFLRCQYTFSLSDYAVRLDIPVTFLPEWRTILDALIRYAASQEGR